MNCALRVAFGGRASCWLLWGMALLLTTGLSARAQAPGWTGAIPGSFTQASGTSQVQAAATDASGNVFVTGYFTGSVTFGGTVLNNAGNAGGADLFVAKYVPATGTWAWAASAGGSLDDRGLAIAVSGSSVYVTGNITNSGGSNNASAVFFGDSGGGAGSRPQLGTSNLASSDLVLAKYTDNGSTATFQWSQVGGGGGDDQGLGVAVSGSSVYVTGSITNTNASNNDNVVVFGGSGTTRGNRPQLGASSSNSQDLVLAKYTDNGSTGTFQWSQVGGGTSQDVGTGVAVSGNNVYVTGSIVNTNASNNDNAVVFGGSGTTRGNSPQLGACTGNIAGQDLLLAKYTDNGSTGAFQWSQVGGGTRADVGTGVAVSGSSVYVTGSITNTNASNNASVVVFGGSGTTRGNSPQLGASSSNSQDLVLAKYTDNGSTGTFQWSQVGGGTANDAGNGLVVSGSNVYVTGYITNSNASNNATTVVFGGSGTTAGSSPQLGASSAITNDVLLAKYADNGSTGTFQGSQVGGGTGTDIGYGVAVSTPAGGGSPSVYAVGSVSNGTRVNFGGVGTDALRGTFALRAVLMSATDAGWQEVVAAYNGGTSTTWAVATDASGNVFVTGTFTGSVTFGSTVLSSAGDNDLFVAKWVPATSTWAWATSAGGTGPDVGVGVAVSGSSVYVTGYVSNSNASGNANAVFFGDSGGGASSPQLGASNTAGLDLVLAKYTDNGSTATFRWSQVGGGTGTDAGNGVAVSGSSVYVTGYIRNSIGNSNAVVFGGSGVTRGTSTQLGVNDDSNNLVLAKYTDNGSTGTFQWSQVGGGISAVGQSVAVSSSSVYVTGYSSISNANGGGMTFGGSGTTMGNRTQLGASSNTSIDMVLAKYTDNGSTGTFQWSQVGGGTGQDVGNGVAVSGSSVYVTGSIMNSNASNNANAVVFGGSGTTLGNSPQLGASSTVSQDILLAKYTDNGSAGAFQWSQVGGGTNSDACNGVAASGSSVYVTGSMTNSNAGSNSSTMVFGGSGTTLGNSPQLGASSTAGQDLVLAKYTDNGSTGTFQWSQVGGGANTDIGYGVAVSGQNVYAAGYVTPGATFGSTNLTAPTRASLNVLTRAQDNALTPLPVQLAAFAARPAGPAAAQLTWATASEVNSAHFEVQRSPDGTTWATLGRVAAAGSSATPRAYAYLDAAAPAGRSYYRLRQIDQDGTAAHSPVQTVVLGGAGLALYPNPAPGAATLVGAGAGMLVQVLDALGRAVATARADAAGTARLAGLAPGLYVVRAGQQALRLTVE